MLHALSGKILCPQALHTYELYTWSRASRAVVGKRCAP